MAIPAARTSIDVGTVIAETYTIEALLGKGGMGAVFLASHARLPGKKVAIKVLYADLADDEVLARFRREAEIASRLGHPNIVAVHDFNVLPDGAPYLVLDYLEGETLGDRIARGPMSLEEASAIVRQIASGLYTAHRDGIVHRDLKPANIFLVPTEVAGNVVDQVKILDFGISKIRGSQTVKTQDAAMLGTPQYMAPEQALGHNDLVDQRTDIFALGVIVYEMLSGAPPFVGGSVPEVMFKVVYEPAPPLDARVAGLPDYVIAAVVKAMEKKREDRFATIADFSFALTRIATSVGTQSHRAADGHGSSKKVLTGGAGNKVADGMAETAAVVSGNHSAAAAAQSLSGFEATMASQPGQSASPIAAVHTIAPAPATERTKGRNPLVMVAATAVVIAAVSVGAFLLVRSGRATPVPPPTVATAAIAPADAMANVASDAAVIATSPPDAAPVAATPPDAAVPSQFQTARTDGEKKIVAASNAKPAASKVASEKSKPAEKHEAAAPVPSSLSPAEEGGAGEVPLAQLTPEQLYVRADNAYRKGRYEVAHHVIRRYVIGHPEDPRGHLLDGLIACKLNQKTAADAARNALRESGNVKMAQQVERMCLGGGGSE